MKRNEAHYKRLKKFGMFPLWDDTGRSIPEKLCETNNIIAAEETQIGGLDGRKGHYVIVHDGIKGGNQFYTRPDGYLPDGTILFFKYDKPDAGQNAVGYVKEDWELDSRGHSPQDIPQRLAQHPPRPPFYLTWRRGMYHLYIPPGALVKAAVYHRDQARDAMKFDNDIDTYFIQSVKSLSDLRFATMIDLTIASDTLRDETLYEIAEMDATLIDAIDEHFPVGGYTDHGLEEFWFGYKEIMFQLSQKLKLRDNPHIVKLRDLFQQTPIDVLSIFETFDEAVYEALDAGHLPENMSRMYETAMKCKARCLGTDYPAEAETAFNKAVFFLGKMIGLTIMQGRIKDV